MYSSQVPVRSLAAPSGAVAPSRVGRASASAALPGPLDPDLQIERAERFGHHYGAPAPTPESPLLAPRGGLPIQAQLRRRRPTPPEESEVEAPRRPQGIGSFAQDRLRSQYQDATQRPGQHIATGTTFGTSEALSVLTHSNPLTAVASVPQTVHNLNEDRKRLQAEVGNGEIRNAIATGATGLTRIGGVIGGALGIPGAGALAFGARQAVSATKTHQKVEPDEAPPPSALTSLRASVTPVVESAAQGARTFRQAVRKGVKNFQGEQE